MSLVAYGDSDSESDEDNCIATEEKKPLSNGGHNIETKIIGSKPFLTLPQPKMNLIEKIFDNDSVKEEVQVVQLKTPAVNSIQEKKEGCSLFPTLPKPKFGGKVKITIPSLNEVGIYLI